MNILELSEQEIVRRESMARMREMGIEPYPAAEFPLTGYTDEIRANFTDPALDGEGNPLPGQEMRRVSIAGRVMSRRIMGKASFMELQDSRGRIQVYVNRDEICPGDDKELYNTVFKKLLDIGDFVGVEGFVFRTQTGEISVHAQSLKVLSKSLRPLPVVKVKDGVTYDAFDDPELRYRRRYVDLVVNDGVKETFIKRTKVFNAMRRYFNDHGYMEVETPILQSIPGAPRRVRSSPTTTPLTYRCISASPTSFTSSASSWAASRGYMNSRRISATRVWTAPTTPSSPVWKSMWPTRTTTG